DHLDIQKAHLAGYSMGGLITLKFATLHPERVRSAVLGGMGWLREGSRLQEFWQRLPMRETNIGETPPACPRSFAALAITEKQLKGIELPVSIIVGDRDPVRRL